MHFHVCQIVSIVCVYAINYIEYTELQMLYMQIEKYLILQISDLHFEKKFFISNHICQCHGPTVNRIIPDLIFYPFVFMFCIFPFTSDFVLTSSEQLRKLK